MRRRASSPTDRGEGRPASAAGCRPRRHWLLLTVASSTPGLMLFGMRLGIAGGRAQGSCGSWGVARWRW